MNAHSINAYKINDLSIGMKAQFTQPVTPEMMRQFLALTGDTNPLHTDPEFARACGFDGSVVYGMLTASLISTLGGCFLPGMYCLIRGVKVQFAKPVYVGDILSVTGEVARLDTDFNYVEIKVAIRNQRGEKVLRGLLKAGFTDDRANTREGKAGGRNGK